METLQEKALTYRAGNIKHHADQWSLITSDKFIIDVVRHGLKINFTVQPPERAPFEYERSHTESKIIDSEIIKLLKKGVISHCPNETGDYFSNLFTRPKKDRTCRTILNLKSLNKDCETYHFKMETLKQAIHMVTRISYLASIDIKDAFYSIPMHNSCKKYLKFMWSCSPYVYNVMPNGYVDAMRVFTKMLKPAFAYLREQGYTSVVYVDDSLLHGLSFSLCMDNVQITLECLQELGFIIHPDKSVLVPTQEITFLGFIFNTVNMTLTLTAEKKQKIVDLSYKLLNGVHTIRTVASFIGNLTASFDAVPGGRLHYRHIELCKIAALKVAKGDFESQCKLSEKASQEIQWWAANIPGAFAHIKNVAKVDYIVFTDASNLGWGASDTTNTINGRWSLEEQPMHINCLEILAVKLALFSLLPLRKDTQHVRIMSDNSTAISYINRQGGTHSLICNDIAVEIWGFCRELGVHISAAHIPGIHNVLADTASSGCFPPASLTSWQTRTVSLLSTYLHLGLTSS